MSEWFCRVVEEYFGLLRRRELDNLSHTIMNELGEGCNVLFHKSTSIGSGESKDSSALDPFDMISEFAEDTNVRGFT